jgi:murein DD-endopeptidase MepM/ murein hydrolase activator NlpD
VVLALPFTGRWTVQNSPAERVPSHGTSAFGTSHAIDFLAVDDRGRTAPRTLRSLVVSEQPDVFVGFGQPVLAPLAGNVVSVHDGETDHEARRSPFTLIAYALGQASRARQGDVALAGNWVAIAVETAGPFVLLAHLRNGSIRVHPGQTVEMGEVIGECGNSGNSTEPHLHVQVSDSTDWANAKGVPLAFRSPRGNVWVPANAEIIEA